MSTDNREQLFPDVIEHYGPAQTPADDTAVSGGLDFAIPSETFTEPETYTEMDADSVIQTDLEPIDASNDDTVFAERDSLAYNEWDSSPYEPHDHVVDEVVDQNAPLHDDPYATAPEWVRAHIPSEPLVMSANTRGGFKAFTAKRHGQKPSTASPDSDRNVSVASTTTPPPPASCGAAGDDNGNGRGKRNVPMLAGVAVAAVSVISAAVVLAVNGEDADTPVPPLPAPTTAVAAPTTAAPAAPQWCTPVTEPDRTVGNDSGGRDTGPAVIQAFEYAYYVERSGEAVADLMVMPSPTSEIQGWIDAVPAGTEHCVTVLPTEDPNRWSVDVLLKMPPVGSEGIHRQWITTAPGDGGLKIATVENR